MLVFVSSTPSTGIKVGQVASNVVNSSDFAFTFFVPAGWSYKTITQGSGTKSLKEWYEIKI